MIVPRSAHQLLKHKIGVEPDRGAVVAEPWRADESALYRADAPASVRNMARLVGLVIVQGMREQRDNQALLGRDQVGRQAHPSQQGALPL